MEMSQDGDKARIEMSQARWLVGAIVPGIERGPGRKLEASGELLLALLHRWRAEAVRAGRSINRIAGNYNLE